MMRQRYIGLFCFLLAYIVGCGAQAYRPKVAPLKIQALAHADFAAFCQKQSKARYEGEAASVTLRLVLEALKTSDCQQAGERLKTLKVLDLHASELSDLRPLVYARALEELSISYSQVTELKPLLELPNLQKLFADGLPLTNDDVALLAQLPRLRELSLVRAAATDLTPLRDKESLHALRLGEGTADLATLEGALLKELLLFRTPAVDLAMLGRLPSLEVLTIEQTPLTDDRVMELAKLSGLRELNLTGSRIGSLAFVQGMSGLKKLYLSDTRVADLKPLRGLKDLEVLALGRTQVENLEVLAGLEQLTHLYLYQTKVSQIEPLEQLKKLRLLSLSQTLVRDIKPLAKLKGLEALFLTNVYAPDKTPLLALPKLKLLYVEGNGLDAELFKRLQRERPGLELFTNPDAAAAR